MFDVVAREDEGALHFLVGHPPVAAVDVQIVFAILKKNANWLWLHFAHQCRVIVSTSEPDVSANAAEHTAETVRSFPRRRPGANRAARSAADRTVIRIG